MRRKKSKFIKDPPYRLYILMRNDLPSMNPGRGMAQAAHASNQFIFEHGKDRRVNQWQADRGFGTTITLAAHQLQIENIIDLAIRKKHKAGLVYDPTYSYVLHMELAECIDRKTFTAVPVFKENGQVVLFRKELTCGYVFLHEDSPDREELMGVLALHP